jgi:lysophospholipase L1-like esterase
MKQRFFPIFSLLVGAAGTALAGEPQSFELKDGDRVVFYGDSITDQRLYTTFTETFAVTRFPKLNVSFVHSGWGGDRVTGGGGGNIDERLKRDVFAYHPSVMTIMLGMNDASYKAFDEKIFETYSKGYEHILDSLHKELPNLRLTLIQPSPFDDVTRKPNFEGGYNAVLVRYGQFVKELGEKNHALVADLNTGVVEATKKADEKNHELATKLNPDRVHPSPAGQLLMAGELLKAWHAPAVVSAVEIDASAGKATRTDKTSVTDISKKMGEAPALRWTQTDEALPMPVDLKDAATSLAINSSDFMDALNRETLKVSGLSGNEYTLRIDGEKVGLFPRAQLEEGINLALYTTPMTKQAQQVHRLTLQHNDIHFTRWRQVQTRVAGDLPHLQEALTGIDALEGDVVKQQRSAAQPKAHHYELAEAKEWASLFNGQDLKGWHSFKMSSVKPGWQVQDGVLVCVDPHNAGDLCTDDKYGWFELQLEFKMAEGSNSGIMYHVTDEANAAWATGPEIQLEDNKAAKDPQRCGWLYALYKPADDPKTGQPIDATKPAGEWNQMRVIISPEKCEHYVNGVKYVEYVLGSDDFKQRVAKSKFGSMPLFAKADAGYIALQGDHGQVSFRNIRIREINPSK